MSAQIDRAVEIARDRDVDESAAGVPQEMPSDYERFIAISDKDWHQHCGDYILPRHEAQSMSFQVEIAAALVTEDKALRQILAADIGERILKYINRETAKVWESRNR